MARVVELKPGQHPPTSEPHALVVASPIPPVERVPILDHEFGRTFFAMDSERDIALIVKRATTWADRREIAVVYLRRETPGLAG